MADTVYLALGITGDGRREGLGLGIAENEGAKFRLAVMTELRNRGVQDILIAVVDGLKDCPEAINSAFPYRTVNPGPARTGLNWSIGPIPRRPSPCIVHLVRHALNVCSWRKHSPVGQQKDREAVAAELREVYSAETAREGLEEFHADWGRHCPPIA
ncbi:MAG: transposase [Pseudomonadota bacterium]